MSKPDLPPEAEPADCGALKSRYQAAGTFAQYSNGASVSDVLHECFTNVVVDVDPSSGDETQTFDSVMECLVDFGNGPLAATLTGPVTVVVHGKGTSTTGTWDTEMISMSLSGSVGGLPVVLRESAAVGSPGATTVRDLGDGQWQIDSFFDVFTEFSVAGGAFERQINPAQRLTLRGVVDPVALSSPDLPPGSGPPCDEQMAEFEGTGIVATYADGFLVRDIVSKCFTNVQVSPVAGTPDELVEFESIMEGVVDDGSGPQLVMLMGPVAVVVHDKDGATTGSWDTEMISMSLTGNVGGVPVEIRESPQVPSMGHTVVAQSGTQYQVDSFFDVFTEISVGGGAFEPQVDPPGALQLRRARPRVALPSPGLPPEGDPEDCDHLASQFVFAGTAVQYPGGVLVQDFVERCFQNVKSSVDPETGDETYDFDATMIGEVDDGTGRQPAILSGPVSVVVRDKGSSTTGTWDTEILSMSLSGDVGGMPVMIRESPQMPSMGQTSVIDAGGGGYLVDSFFDVYTEISIGGGAYEPQTSPAATMKLQPKAPSVILTSPVLPPEAEPASCADLVSRFGSQSEVSYPRGFRLLEFASECFQNVDTNLDPTSGDETSTFQSTVEAVVDDGGTLVTVMLAGPVTTVVHGKGTNATGHWDTEMVSMSLTGDVAGVPIEIRESPSLPSPGETTVRALGGTQYEVDSFFDVYTEISIGGAAFEPQTGPAGVVVLDDAQHGVGNPSLPPSRGYVLYDANPNPFNPVTTLSFEIPTSAHVRLAIYDMAGRLVRTLVNETLTEGRHDVVWTGRDLRDQPVASGVYLYQITSQTYSEAKSMVLVR